VIRLLIIILLIYLLYKVVNGVKLLKLGKKENLKYESTAAGGEDLIEDPVCHTYIPISQAYKKEISGKDYYFCSKKCSEKYTLEKNN
jgi:YHS domain-containing protein